MKRIVWLFFLFPILLFAQNDPKAALQQLEFELAGLKEKQESVLGKIENVKLEMLRNDLEANGLPELREGEKLIKHSAMYLVYSEEHEQAAWVAHVILPDVLTGKVSRTNDFRTDPLVETGTTEEIDFFLTKTLDDGSTEYDGFGFDRGHLAPSADFRWSQTALSESYFYSNMSPQRPDFNRGIWASVEGKIRGYLNNNPNVQLYVVTGPVLKPGLPVVERSVNKPSIPDQYFKVVMDLENQRGIAFLLNNEKGNDPVSSYAVTIDKIEELTGIDFFHNVPDVIEEGLESAFEPEKWLPKGSEGDVKALDPTTLPKNNFNTKQAELYKGRNDNVTICGTVVGARTSRAGNVLLNLDKQYPNQIFTVFIRKEDLGNFSYDLVEAWKGQVIAVSGKVASMGSTPAMYVKHEKEIKAFDGKR